MSNNTKRLSFFAKIAQRSTALQSLLEEATGKSARDSQGNVIAVEGLHDGHKPFVARPVYATERYQKDIELAQDIPAPPTGPRTAVFNIEFLGSSYIGVRKSDWDDPTLSYPYAWDISGMGTYKVFTESENIGVGDVGHLWATGTWVEDPVPVMAVNEACLLVSVIPYNAIVPCRHIVEGAHEGHVNWDSMLSIVGTASETPSVGDTLWMWGDDEWEECSPEQMVIHEFIPTANSSNTSNAISSESINPNTESRVKHVKDFYRGESNWFMGEVGIKNYPFYRHVGWTAPAVTDGTLSATADGYPLNNGSAALGGSTIVFTATPATGKQVASWSGLPAGATTEGNTATFTLTSDVNVSATFEDVPAVAGPAVIEIDTGGSEHPTIARDEANDDDNPGVVGVDKMYAWGFMNGYIRLGTASPNPSVGDPVWMYQNEWVHSEAFPAFVDNVTLGKCISIRAKEELGVTYALDGYNPTPSTSFEGYYEWSGYGGEQFFTLRDNPSPLDVVYGADGSTLVEAGSVLMYSNILPVVQPLYFSSETEGATLHLTCFAYGDEEQSVVMQSGHDISYRAANSDEWTPVTFDTFEYDEEEECYYATTTDSISLPCYLKAANIRPGVTVGEEPNDYAWVRIGFSDDAEDVVVSGNITSLCGKCGTTDNTMTNDTWFYELFYGSPISDASNLVLADNLTAYGYEEDGGCYSYMFGECESLTEAPELPVTTLANGCYSSMFYGCTSLENPPALPATTLADSCYSGMFQACTSISISDGFELPAETLAPYCYRYMFGECGSLGDNIPANFLPATTLAVGCYASMFKESDIYSAPVLPATTLVEECYFDMFTDCRELIAIWCNATDRQAELCTGSWVSGVSEQGDFFGKASCNPAWIAASEGYPEGWRAHLE